MASLVTATVSASYLGDVVVFEKRCTSPRWTVDHCRKSLHLPRSGIGSRRPVLSLSHERVTSRRHQSTSDVLTEAHFPGPNVPVSGCRIRIAGPEDSMVVEKLIRGLAEYVAQLDSYQLTAEKLQKAMFTSNNSAFEVSPYRQPAER